MYDIFVDLFEIIGFALTDLIDSMRTGLIHRLGGYTLEDDVGILNKVEHICVTRKYSRSSFLDGRAEYNEAKLKAELLVMIHHHIRQYVDFESTVDPATDEYVTNAHIRVVNLKEDNYNAQH